MCLKKFKCVLIKINFVHIRRHIARTCLLQPNVAIIVKENNQTFIKTIFLDIFDADCRCLIEMATHDAVTESVCSFGLT